MADNITLNAGTGGSDLATDDVGGVHYQIGKVAFGALDSATLAASGAGAVAAGVQRVTLASDDPAVTALQVLDNAISGTEMQVDVVAALPAGTNNIGDVDVASIAAGDNNIGNVDIVTFPTEVHSADYDSGAGTDTTLAFGIAVPASGGAAVVTGDAANGLDVDVTRVSGTVTVDGSGVTQPVSHAALTELAAAIDTEVQVDIVGALPAGTNNIGDVDILSIAAGDNNIGNVDVVTLPALPAGNNNIGDVDVASIAAGTNSIGNVGLIGRASGGMTIFRSIDLDETEEEVKATAGQVFSISAFNHTAAPLFLKFYNLTAANTTVGTSTPVATFTVPGNADSDGAGFVWNNTIGLAFSTAISVAVTTAIADADTGAPAANACSVVIGYV